MALQGTMKDFGLPDIFQLIGIQRKTGILTLDDGDDTVVIRFLDGQVVGADTRTETQDDRLGSVLVRTGRISEAQLQDALRRQKETLQRLGYILVRSGYISEEDLVDALRVQSTQIIYRLFRWREGSYKFDPVEDLDYDERHFTPISSDTILMEGARMIDEWPIIERRIRSANVILRKTDTAEVLSPGVQSILEQDIDLQLGIFGDEPEAPAPENPQDDEIRLSPEERVVLELVDGSRRVEDICELSSYGEFDTYRILYELLTRNLIEECRRRVDSVMASAPKRSFARVAAWAIEAAIAGAVILAVATMSASRVTPWKLVDRGPTGAELRLYTSLARLERIEKALDVFYLDVGAVPHTLAQLTRQGYLRTADLHDPWYRPYEYQVSPGGYRLAGLDADGREQAELTISRRFNAVQRIMVGGTGRPEGSSP